jgi:hypothetical protein
VCGIAKLTHTHTHTKLYFVYQANPICHDLANRGFMFEGTNSIEWVAICIFPSNILCPKQDYLWTLGQNYKPVNFEFNPGMYTIVLSSPIMDIYTKRIILIK